MKTTFEFKTLTDFTDYFCDEATCVKHYTEIRFGNGEYCPHCGHTEIYKFSNGKRYRCAKCKQDFTIKTGTVFGESKLPLRKWFMAIYLLSTTSKGISSVQLAKHVGVTQKTAWFMAHRIREAHQQNKGQLFGKIEADETFIGGLSKNMHKSKRRSGNQGNWRRGQDSGVWNEKPFRRSAGESCPVCRHAGLAPGNQKQRGARRNTLHGRMGWLSRACSCNSIIQRLTTWRRNTSTAIATRTALNLFGLCSSAVIMAFITR